MENLINLKWAEIHELRSFLTATDYKVIKSYETDYAITEEVLTKRAAARERINVLEAEIKLLEQEMKESETNNPIEP